MSAIRDEPGNRDPWRGPLRILMVNRADSARAVGGDTIQMEKTRQELIRLGCHVDVRLTNELEGCDFNYDAVHLFNIQTAEESWRAVNEIKRRDVTLALSPVYWDPLPAWFREAPGKSRTWRTIVKAIGRGGAYPLYAMWQRRKLAKDCSWNRQRQMLLAADAILPNSNMEARQLQKDFRLPSSVMQSMGVVPNGVDRSLFEHLQVSRNTLPFAATGDFALQVGRVSPEKNPLGVIEGLWHSPLQLVFIGKPAAQALDYYELCKEKGRQRGRVHFADWVSHEQLPGIYAAAKVHVLPSWRETPGLASLEAAAAGCPIVSTSIGSAREYFGADAYYCNPENTDSIRRAVEAALAAPRAARLRRRVLANFTWEIAAHRTLDCYRTMLVKKGTAK